MGDETRPKPTVVAVPHAEALNTKDEVMAVNTPVSQTCDVLVAGSGIAGLAAAIRAVEAGADVLVVEKDSAFGGNAKWAGGFDIEAHSFDGMRAQNPEGDPVLQRPLVEDFKGALEWLRKLGVELAPDDADPQRFNYVPHQGQGGIRAFRALHDQLTSLGGELLLETALVRLVTNDAGDVVGAECKRDDRPYSIASGATIVATGSFTRNVEMKVRFFGPNGDRTSYYGSDRHDGDGILAGLEVGAALSTGVSVGTGGCVFAPPFQPPAGEFGFLGAGGGLDPEQRKTPEPVPAGVQNLIVRPPAWGDSASILVNLEGRRYVDESSRYTVIGWSTTNQSEGVGFCVFDQQVYEEASVDLDTAAEFGATLYTADTIAELARQLSNWRATPSYHAGVDPHSFVTTIADYNSAADGDGEIWPRRTRDFRPIDRPPFHAAPVVQGVVDAAGGLKIDENGRVLYRSGKPIRGLYAAGADAGRAYSREHGGLSFGLIFGRRAGRHAAAHAAGRTVGS